MGDSAVSNPNFYERWNYLIDPIAIEGVGMALHKVQWIGQALTGTEMVFVTTVNALMVSVSDFVPAKSPVIQTMITIATLVGGSFAMPYITQAIFKKTVTVISSEMALRIAGMNILTKVIVSLGFQIGQGALGSIEDKSLKESTVEPIDTFAPIYDNSEEEDLLMDDDILEEETSQSSISKRVLGVVGILAGLLGAGWYAYNQRPQNLVSHPDSVETFDGEPPFIGPLLPNHSFVQTTNNISDSNQTNTAPIFEVLSSNEENQRIVEEEKVNWLPAAVIGGSVVTAGVVGATYNRCSHKKTKPVRQLKRENSQGPKSPIKRQQSARSLVDKSKRNSISRVGKFNKVDRLAFWFEKVPPEFHEYVTFQYDPQTPIENKGKGYGAQATSQLSPQIHEDNPMAALRTERAIGVTMYSRGFHNAKDIRNLIKQYTTENTKPSISYIDIVFDERSNYDVKELINYFPENNQTVTSIGFRKSRNVKNQDLLEIKKRLKGLLSMDLRGSNIIPSQEVRNGITVVYSKHDEKNPNSFVTISSAQPEHDSMNNKIIKARKDYCNSGSQPISVASTSQQINSKLTPRCKRYFEPILPERLQHSQEHPLAPAVKFIKNLSFLSGLDLSTADLSELIKRYLSLTQSVHLIDLSGCSELTLPILLNILFQMNQAPYLETLDLSNCPKLLLSAKDIHEGKTEITDHVLKKRRLQDVFKGLQHLYNKGITEINCRDSIHIDVNDEKQKEFIEKMWSLLVKRYKETGKTQTFNMTIKENGNLKNKDIVIDYIAYVEAERRLKNQK